MSAYEEGFKKAIWFVYTQVGVQRTAGEIVPEMKAYLKKLINEEKK